jgi:nitrogen fixation NifU-like protein
MSDLTDLYQEVILDHHRAPRNYGTLGDANRHARGHNPLCGDRLTLALRIAGDRIDDVRFEGAGCAISRASASMMTEAVKGQPVSAAEALFDRFHAMVTAPPDAPVDEEGMGKLASLAGVRAFPVRVKCASLAWHTLKAALASAAPEPVSTE